MATPDEWPYYRDPDLTDEVAMQAMVDAANYATREVLNARRDMLAAGISATHPMCRILDNFASCMTYVVTDHRITDPTPVVSTSVYPQGSDGKGGRDG